MKATNVVLSTLALAAAGLALAACSPCADIPQYGEGDVMGTGSKSGLERCGEKEDYRYAQLKCQSKYTPAACTIEAAPEHDCAVDADCTGGQTGICHDQWSGCYCAYLCEQDHDCKKDQACLCGAAATDGVLIPYSRCYPAECRTDDDCSMQRCGLSRDLCGKANGLYCHTGDDECTGDGDCENNAYCGYVAEKKMWACRGPAKCE